MKQILAEVQMVNRAIPDGLVESVLVVDLLLFEEDENGVPSVVSTTSLMITPSGTVFEIGSKHPESQLQVIYTENGCQRWKIHKLRKTKRDRQWFEKEMKKFPQLNV